MHKFIKVFIWAVFLIPGIYLFLSWPHIPATVPMHFDLKGNADKYGSKNELAYLIAGLTALNITVYLLFCNVYRIDPKRNALDNKERMQRMAVIVSIFLSLICTMIIYTAQQPDASVMSKFIFVAMGPFFSLLGNYMYNIKPNYFAGIRVPWTLEDPDNWRKTHQLAGRLWFGGGILITIAALLCKTVESAGIAMFIIVLPLTIIPVIYSYRLYIHQKKTTEKI